MKITDDCKKCLTEKYSKKCPSTLSAAEKEAFRLVVARIIEENADVSAPEIVEKINEYRLEHFGEVEDYSEIKRFFNTLMLTLENKMRAEVEAADDPLCRAVQYAMGANFIDFGAMGAVDENKLCEILDGSCDIEIDKGVLEDLRADIKKAKNIVFFTDNCGEIVADKVLMSAIKAENPGIHLTAIVRGAPILNDATLEDAEQVGLSLVADSVIGNGNAIAGNVLSRASTEAMDRINESDLLISKGQGNFETLFGCGLNVYYVFMCKCDLFVKRFDVPLYTGLLVKEI